MSNETWLHEYRLFMPTDFREEQTYLENKAKSGWIFSGVKRYRYSFLKGKPEKATFIRDFKEDDIFVDDYIQMYEDAGFEFVFRTDENYYFKRTGEFFPEELEEFSTYYDRAEYFGELHMKKMSNTFVVVLIALAIVVGNTLAGTFQFSNVVDSLASIFSLVALFLSASWLVFLFLKYRRIMDIKLTPEQEQEKREEAEEEEREKEIKVEPYAGDKSVFGEYPNTELSFEEILESKLK